MLYIPTTHNMNISFTAKQSEDFAVLMQLFEKLTDSINLRFSQESLLIQSMDNSHVMFLDICLNADFFETYACSQPMTLGIHTKRMNSVMKPRKKNQGMQWDSNIKEAILNITYPSVDLSNKMEFQMGLVDIDEDINNIPAYNEIALISMKSAKFHEIIADMLTWGGNSLKIDCNEESIQCTTANELNDKFTTEIKLDDLEGFSIDESGALTVQYQLKFLALAASALHKLRPCLELYLHDEMPLKIMCNMGEDESQGSHCILYITGLVEDSDD